MMVIGDDDVFFSTLKVYWRLKMEGYLGGRKKKKKKTWMVGERAEERSC